MLTATGSCSKHTIPLADNGKDALISLPADYDDFETGDDHEGNRIVLS